MENVTVNSLGTGDPLWYKDAIIYELNIRGFADANGDGIGDFLGLTEKLDYLEDLGVTALWLLPFYPSPLRDDGYDISDYRNIHPAYGTMQDFKAFLDDAHRRGIRVITELVLNHTSDLHPWFSRARKWPKGSRRRDFYVWSDSADKYREARIIFKDFEHSNWTWDHEAQAYYWHRFYSHQPDLNYDNPAVAKAIFQVVDFWLGLGVDGLRADAVPYLYERENTNCENLRETHRFVKALRHHIERRFANRMLLAEANQWPEDVAPYFGDGDEFHMAFHFPVMPRLFMALRREDRFPIIDILRQTPLIPETSQWALFLRNHDELTLEMVTDEDRDYMYRAYAVDPASRLNLGIRRRLAPLLNNDRRKIELLNGLLLSLPGTPVIYCGDEIGMGDNIYLGDRNSVRTPMQWSPDRNSGFSRANPQKLYLPLIIDPEYHYEAINVETQQNNPDSLLWWMKRIISLRKRFKAFGRGQTQFLFPSNRKVLAFVRRYEDETILVVANLASTAQQTALELSQFAGYRPVELFGRIEFSPVDERPYPLMLGPYGFYWFSLKRQPVEAPHLRVPEGFELPLVVVTEPSRVLDLEENEALSDALLQYMTRSRWFRAKARRARLCRIEDTIPIDTAYLAIVELGFYEGEDQTYLLALALASGEESPAIKAKHPWAAVARIRTPGAGEEVEMLLYDALVNDSFCRRLMTAIGSNGVFTGTRGKLLAASTSLFDSLAFEESLRSPKLLQAEQTNSSIAYGNRLIFKLFRQIEEGINPEVEIGRMLTERTEFPNIAQVAGTFEYERRDKKRFGLGILQAFMENEGDAWRYTLEFLSRYSQDVLSHPRVQIPPMPRYHVVLLRDKPPDLVQETMGSYLTAAELLGKRTAELHIALASLREEPDFAPEPISKMHLQSLYQSMRTGALKMLQQLRDRLDDLPQDALEDGKELLTSEDRILRIFDLLRSRRIEGYRIRCHEDYHLGQVLFTGKDFVIIDFEGEPARPLSERRLKRSPIQDVAGMIRSFHYAAFTTLRQQGTLAGKTEADEAFVLQQWLQFWYLWVSAGFIGSYRETVGPHNLVPADADDFRVLLDAYLMDKAVYEVGYELNHRPGWVGVPIHGILSLLADSG